jgi:hypothetical protein
MPVAKTVKIDREIQRRLRRKSQLWHAAQEFVSALEAGQHPPRIYKKSGVAKDGSTFDAYVRLNLYHHHLHASGDPLLVMQEIDNVVYCFALSNHADYINGDKMLWLRRYREAISWDGCQDLENAVLSYAPKP